MDFNCQSCSFSKPIESKHYAEFAKKYVMDGQVMCPKCQKIVPLTKGQSKLLGVNATYEPAPAVKQAVKVAASKSKPQAQSSSRNTSNAQSSSHKDAMALAAMLQVVSSIVFIGIMLSGGISGMLGGLQSGSAVAVVGGAVVGCLLALLPAFISSVTFRFFSQTLKLLVEIASKE